MPRHATAHQRELMRRFYREHRGDASAVCEAYVRAEADGRAFRKFGDYRLSPHDYARALFRHGREQGWLAG